MVIEDKERLEEMLAKRTVCGTFELLNNPVESLLEVLEE